MNNSQCSFVFHQVGHAHISGGADNFIKIYAEFLHDYNDAKIIKISTDCHVFYGPQCTTYTTNNKATVIWQRLRRIPLLLTPVPLPLSTRDPFSLGPESLHLK